MLESFLGMSSVLQNIKKNVFSAWDLPITRGSDSAVLNKDNATNIGKVKINTTEWNVPHYTPSITQQASLFKQRLNKTTTELQNIERSFFMEE